MALLRAAELLRLCEESAALSPRERATRLVQAAHPEWPVGTARTLTLGARDAHLLALREHLFGAAVSALTRCPACDAAAEIEFAVGDVLLPPHADAGATVRIERDGWTVSSRLPDVDDLAAVDDRADLEAARAALLDRCLLSACRGDREVAAADIPSAILAEVTASMAARDPQANMLLALTCSACTHVFQAPFDVASFVCAELNAWAVRLLRDVHLLASAYGWSEAEILALSPWRRQVYLELVAA